MGKLKWTENFDGLDEIDLKEGYHRYVTTIGDWCADIEGNDEHKEVVANIWRKGSNIGYCDRYLKSFKGAKRYVTNFMKSKGVI